MPKLRLVDARKEHYYQPGFTLVGAGIKPADYAVSQTGSYVPSGVQWVQERVAEIDPEGNKVVTQSGQVLPYDFLIVATGLQLEYGRIEGMEPGLIGQHGIGSIYNGPDAAAATWGLMSQFATQGGRGVFTRPGTEMKCAGAPLKYTFLSEDRATRQGGTQQGRVCLFLEQRGLVQRAHRLGEGAHAVQRAQHPNPVPPGADSH